MPPAMVKFLEAVEIIRTGELIMTELEIAIQRLAEENRKFAKFMRLSGRRQEKLEKKRAEDQRISEEKWRIIEEKRVEDQRISEEKWRLFEEKRAEDQRISEEKWRIIDEKRAEERRLAEEKRAEERRLAEEKRAEDQRISEEKWRLFEEKRAEERRLADEKRAEERRLAEEKRAEERRLAEEKRAEERRHTEEQRAKAEEQHAKLREQDTKLREQDLAEQRKIEKSLRDRMHKLDDQWARLVESLINNQLVPLLNAAGIPVNDTLVRRKGIRNGQRYEFDIVAINGDTIVVAEVKSTLRPDDVKDFVGKLPQVRTFMPEYSDKQVVGALAYISVAAAADLYAQREGLFTILATGEGATMTNPPGFKAKKF
ncbi:MAG: hypothetical protein ACRCUY_10815 [Thermoguttaceae bacterium]